MPVQPFSAEQWQFLATLAAVGGTASIALLGDLTPVAPGPLMEIITRGTQGGWLIHHDDKNTLRLKTHGAPDLLRNLETINTPAQLDLILKRLGALPQQPDNGLLIKANLLEHCGQCLEAARLEYEATRQAIYRRDLEGAFELIQQSFEHLHKAPECGERQTLYVSAALTRIRLSYLLGVDLDETPLHLETAIGMSKALGDHRSLALFTMYHGMYAYLRDHLDEALESLEAGIRMAVKLGDEDILQQCTEFEGLTHYIRGHYREAADLFEHALQQEHDRDDQLPNHFLPLFIGHSTALLGHFHRATGVLDSNRRRARLMGDHHLETLYQATLGLVLLRMNRRREALCHLKQAMESAQQQHNDRALYFARRGMIFYHYLDGRLDIAEQLASSYGDSDDEAQDRTWPLGPQYTWPVILEVTFFSDHHGYGPALGHDPDRDAEKILHGPNDNLRGTLKRIRARQAAGRGEEGAEKLLISSLEDLQHSGDPIELAKTRMDLARLRLAAGDRNGAASLALEAWEGISGHWPEIFPDDLRALVDIEPPQDDDPGSEELLGRFMDMMDGFVPSDKPDELLFRLVSATSRFFHAERGGLFWFSGPGSKPQLRGAYNIGPGEVEAQDFRDNLTEIFRVYRNNQPLCKHLRGPGQPRYILCLPVETEGAIHGVLFYENTCIDKGFIVQQRELLVRISRHVSAYVERISAFCRLIEERSQQAGPQQRADAIITANTRMKNLLYNADQVASTDAAILILGETGTGKELLSSRIHTMSSRREHSFIAVDLTSLPETLVDSELFGHEKGAFTGADRQKPGRLELAHGGTLFIDEIGEIPLSIQVKLLRALQEKTFVRVGGTRSLHSDFRLISATNRDLEKEVARGNFREDLYYRLNVIPLTMPPLRERNQDIILLALHFLEVYARKYHRAPLSLSPQDESRVLAYHWPGNVRELKNIMERAVLLSNGNHPRINLPTGSGEPASDEILSLSELERRHIRHVLDLTGGKIAGAGGAADLLGLNRSTLYARMKKLGI